MISVSCSIINCSGSKKIGKEDYLCLFPSDSTLLTETQLNQKTEIARFIRDKIILEEKTIRLQYKKKELRDYNFPKQYIKWINNDINNFNAFIETSNDAVQLLNDPWAAPGFASTSGITTSSRATWTTSASTTRS